MRRAALALFFVVTGAAPTLALSIEPIGYVAADGTDYIWNTDENGIVYIAPVADLTDRFFLTPDCVAMNATYGTGSWGYDAAGWQIAFNNRYQINFPDTMPPLDPGNCMMLR